MQDPKTNNDASLRASAGEAPALPRELSIGCSPMNTAKNGEFVYVASVQEAGALKERFSQIFWQTGLEDAESGLPKVRALLQDRGRLLVLGHGGEPSGALRAVVEALSAQGFVILEQNGRWPSHWRKPTRNAFWSIVAKRDAFTVRGYAPGDEAAILQLFAPSFHVERTPEHWRWKYRDHPFGSLRLSMAWSPQGELAAHHGAYPARLWHNGSILPAQHIGDLMTDPRFRRVGLGPRSLLARCAQHSYAVFGPGRVAFNYGFNTSTSLEYSVRFMQAQKVAPVGFWTARPEDFLGTGPSGYQIRIEKTFDRRFDRFFARVAPDYASLFERRSAYLNWRYIDRPDADYLAVSAFRWWRRVGWAVFRRQGDDLIWGDGLFARRHSVGAVQALLKAALESPVGQQARRVTAWSSGVSWWLDSLKELGFSSESEPNGLWLNCVPHDLPNAAAVLRSTFYMMGDGDLF